MEAFLWMLASLVAYIAGLILVVKGTPRLLFYSYSDVKFMLFAMLDILGALLVFGSVVILLFTFDLTFGIRALNFILLMIVILITGRMAFFCFRNHKRGVQPVSRYGAGSFCLFLALAAIYCIVQLFKP